MRFQDEILIQTVRETGDSEDLTSISIDEQMQIAKSMGIEVGGADTAEQYAAELTQKMGLSSGGVEEQAEDEEDDSAEEAKKLMKEVFQTSTSILRLFSMPTQHINSLPPPGTKMLSNCWD